MHRIALGFGAAALTIAMLPTAASAHCEIPCGIYDDHSRIQMIEEHIATIEKSMNQIVELSNAPDTNYNQLVRWVINKDQHAEKLQHIVTQYFMTQRLRAPEKKDPKAYMSYVEQLTLLHQMLVYAMKAKQTTELENVTKLQELTASFEAAYFAEEEGEP